MPGSMQELAAGADALLAQRGELVAVVSLVFGLAFCAFGYRLFLVVLGICGFIAGAAAGWSLAGNYHPEAAVVFGLVGGLLGAALATLVLGVGVFVFGAFLGTVAVTAAAQAGGGAPNGVALVVVALACGAVAVFVVRPLIILATSYGGAWSAVTGGGFLAGLLPRELMFGRIPDDELFRNNAATLFVAWIVLGSLGALVQSAAASKDEPKGAAESDEHEASEAADAKQEDSSESSSRHS